MIELVLPEPKYTPSISSQRNYIPPITILVALYFRYPVRCSRSRLLEALGAAMPKASIHKYNKALRRKLKINPDTVVRNPATTIGDAWHLEPDTWLVTPKT